MKASWVLERTNGRRIALERTTNLMKRHARWWTPSELREATGLLALDLAYAIRVLKQTGQVVEQRHGFTPKYRHVV